MLTPAGRESRSRESNRLVTEELTDVLNDSEVVVCAPAGLSRGELPASTSPAPTTAAIRRMFVRLMVFIVCVLILFSLFMAKTSCLCGGLNVAAARLAL